MFEFEENLAQNAKIKVVGVGGGGGNVIQTMIKSGLEGVEFIVANTDAQALRNNQATVKIQLGAQLTKGLGAGANPEVGRQAAMEDEAALAQCLQDADMVFITAGMGGGTGTGAAPIIAKVAKACGALTVGVVTKPFSFEGKKRARYADGGIEALQDEVDTLITIPNDRLLSVSGKDMPMVDAFKNAAQVLLQAVRGISDLITIPGLINLDFADVRTVMQEMGMALMGTGYGRGENRAIEAAKQAISSPLLENVSIAGATGVLINITGASNMTLFEVNEASKLIQEEAHEDANIIFGAVIDDTMEDDLRITVIATGFNKREKRHAGPAAQARQIGKPAFRSAVPRIGATSGEEHKLPLVSPAAYPSSLAGNFATRPASSADESMGGSFPDSWQDAAPAAFHGQSMAPSFASRREDHGFAAAGGASHVSQMALPSTFDSRSDLALKEVEPMALPPEKAKPGAFRQMIKEIGLINMDGEDEYDIPTFIRRQAD